MRALDSSLLYFNLDRMLTTALKLYGVKSVNLETLPGVLANRGTIAFIQGNKDLN